MILTVTTKHLDKGLLLGRVKRVHWFEDRVGDRIALWKESVLKSFKVVPYLTKFSCGRLFMFDSCPSRVFGQPYISQISHYSHSDSLIIHGHYLTLSRTCMVREKRKCRLS